MSMHGGAVDVLFRLRRKGVRIWSDDGRLRFQAPKGVLTPEEILNLRALRAEIVAFLQQSAPAPEPPLVPRLPSDRVPLTFSQQWIWNTLGSEKETCMGGLLAQVVRLSGQLNVGVLRQSFTELVHRHESLRTRIVTTDGVPRQHIDKAREYDLESIDLTVLPERERETAARRLVERLAYRSCCLALGPLFATSLLKLTDREHLLVITIDHIISDLSSLGILLHEALASYAQFARGLPASIPEISIQFADYAVWQQTTDQCWIERHDAYWRRRLAGARRVRLTTDERVPKAQSVKQMTVPFTFDETMTAELRELSRQKKTTLVLSIFSAYVMSVLRWYNEDEIVIPFITTGRRHFEVENSIGFFGAPLFLRVAVFENDSFLDLLERVTYEYGAASEHHDSCRIAAQVPEPEFVWNPVFNWIPRAFNVGLCAEVPNSEAGDVIGIEPYEIAPREDVKWDGELRMDLSDTEYGVKGTIGFRADRFTMTAVERFKRTFRSFAQQLARDPKIRVASVPWER